MTEKGYVPVQSTALSQLIPHGRNDSLSSPSSRWHTRCYQHFCWGATPLLKTTSQPRALLTRVMQSCSASAWQCSRLPPPKPPKTSLSLSPSLCLLFSFWPQSAVLLKCKNCSGCSYHSFPKDLMAYFNFGNLMEDTLLIHKEMKAGSGSDLLFCDVFSLNAIATFSVVELLFFILGWNCL